MNEVVLDQNIEVEIDPAGLTMVIQNTMPGETDLLYISKDAGSDRSWMAIGQGDSVKFATVVWLKQSSKTQWIFPVYEIS